MNAGLEQKDTQHVLLRVYAYYRTLLSSLFLLMFLAGIAINILGTNNPNLFFLVASGHTVLNIVALLLLWRSEFSATQEQTFTLLFIDIFAIILLMHSSGTDSGLGFLLLASAAIGGILLRSQIAFLLAATTSILVISESIYNALQMDVPSKQLFSAGTLGLLLFATVMLFRYLTSILAASQKESLAQAQHAAHLERLSQQIIGRMNTGIIVLNHQSEPLLVNQAAQRLLNLQSNSDKLNLSDIPEIEDQLQIWKAYPHSRTPFIKLADDNAEVRINFARLEDNIQSDILIFVEDNRQLSQQAQQLKLASLGRLTASIAHEVRNPLGAISHASQLLGESSQLDAPDRRLTEIIDSHSIRVNNIIENVLQLSRRKETHAEVVHLGEWLEHFIDEFSLSLGQDIDISLEQNEEGIKANVDPSQLHQVLTNLCENGLRYSQELTGRGTLSIIVDTEKLSGLPMIDVIDDGPGIADEHLANIFEPFYTSDPAGSGLGLYICQELCQANEANLHYLRTESGKSCFRLTLAHEQRVFR